MLTQIRNPGFQQSVLCRVLCTYINPTNFSFCTSPVKMYMSISPHGCLHSSENAAVSHKGPLPSGITTCKGYSLTEQAQKQRKVKAVKFLHGRYWRKRGDGRKHIACPTLNHQSGVCGRIERQCYLKMLLCKILNSLSPANHGHKSFQQHLPLWNSRPNSKWNKMTASPSKFPSHLQLPIK